MLNLHGSSCMIGIRSPRLIEVNGMLTVEGQSVTAVVSALSSVRSSSVRTPETKMHITMYSRGSKHGGAGVMLDTGVSS